MSAEPERNRAKQRRHGTGYGDREQQTEPRRNAMHRRQPGGRVGADAYECRLAKRGEAADAGEQHDAENDQRIAPRCN